jgi:hypothetical protein
MRNAWSIVGHWCCWDLHAMTRKGGGYKKLNSLCVCLRLAVSYLFVMRRLEFGHRVLDRLRLPPAAHIGSTLGSFGAHMDIVFGPFAVIMGQRGPSMGPYMGPLWVPRRDHTWAHIGLYVGSCGSMFVPTYGPAWNHIGPCMSPYLGLYWAHLEHLWGRRSST